MTDTLNLEKVDVQKKFLGRNRGYELKWGSRENCLGKEHLVRNRGFWANQNGAFWESGCLAGKGLFGVSANDRMSRNICRGCETKCGF